MLGLLYLDKLINEDSSTFGEGMAYLDTLVKQNESKNRGFGKGLEFLTKIVRLQQQCDEKDDSTIAMELQLSQPSPSAVAKIKYFLDSNWRIPEPVAILRRQVQWVIPK